MNTISEAVHEYVALRRSLGFKLIAAKHYLLQFATFLEEQQATYITQELALAWAQPTHECPTVQMGRTPDQSPGICALSSRGRSPYRSPGARTAAISPETGKTSPLLRRGDTGCP